MNYLVFLDAQASELEKILSGIKSMVVKEFDPALANAQNVSPGDSLYFLRNNEDCDLRVKATVVRVLTLAKLMDDNDAAQIFKEMQPRLQLTETQYHYWSARGQVQLVEFDSAQKIGLVQVDLNKVTDRANWIAFDKFSLITE